MKGVRPTHKGVPDDPAQSKRFREAARELGPDETGEAFERAFMHVSQGRPAQTDRASVQKTLVALIVRFHRDPFHNVSNKIGQLKNVSALLWLK
jgi:hypothetical protein